MFDLGEYVACICEGAAEEAIMDILIDHHLLIFEREKLIDEKIIRARSAEAFEKQYLRMGFAVRETPPEIMKGGHA